jgi:hypothetical protein
MPFSSLTMLFLTIIFAEFGNFRLADSLLALISPICQGLIYRMEVRVHSPCTNSYEHLHVSAQLEKKNTNPLTHKPSQLPLA